MDIDALSQIMEESANPDQAKQMKHYMKDHFDFYGIKSTQRREISRPFVRAPIQLWQEEHTKIKGLWDADKREMQYIAMDRFLQVKKLYARPSMEFVEYLIIHKSWWDTVDFLASNVVYQHLLMYPDFKTEYVLSWIDADNIWLNRSAIIWQLKRKDDVDVKFLEDAIQPHLNSKEFFIQKAIGWSLRQYSKFNPTWVRNFIKKYHIRGLAMHEASKYL